MAARRKTATRRTTRAERVAPLRALLDRAGRASRALVTALVLGLVLVLLARGVALLYEQPVMHIAVSGKLDGEQREAVRSTGAARIDSGLLALDLQAPRAELESLPWVSRASLRRQFPAPLEISVLEQRPIARWGDGAFLNHEARVVEVTDAQRWEALPMIRGPEGSQRRVMAHYQRLRELLRPLELTPVSLEEDDFGQLTMMLERGVEVVFGDREQFATRVDNLLTQWRQALRTDEARVRRIDLRYAGGAAVAFDDSPGLPALATAIDDR